MQLAPCDRLAVPHELHFHGMIARQRIDEELLHGHADPVAFGGEGVTDGNAAQLRPRLVAQAPLAVAEHVGLAAPVDHLQIVELVINRDDVVNELPVGQGDVAAEAREVTPVLPVRLREGSQHDRFVARVDRLEPDADDPGGRELGLPQQAEAARVSPRRRGQAVDLVRRRRDMHGPAGEAHCASGRAREYPTLQEALQAPRAEDLAHRRAVALAEKAQVGVNGPSLAHSRRARHEPFALRSDDDKLRVALEDHRINLRILAPGARVLRDLHHVSAGPGLLLGKLNRSDLADAGRRGVASIEGAHKLIIPPDLEDRRAILVGQVADLHHQRLCLRGGLDGDDQRIGRAVVLLPDLPAAHRHARIIPGVVCIQPSGQSPGHVGHLRVLGRDNPRVSAVQNHGLGERA